MNLNDNVEVVSIEFNRRESEARVVFRVRDVDGNSHTELAERVPYSPEVRKVDPIVAKARELLRIRLSVYSKSLDYDETP